MSQWKNYKYEVPDKRKVRYIIHTDCKNEADDQFTVAHALMMDRLEVKGIIAGHFDMGNQGTHRFPDKTTAAESRKEVDKILELMGLSGKYPVFTGAQEGLADEKTPQVTDSARFIVQEAMKDDPRPLYIGMQGAVTDLASANLMEPKICERMTCIWIGGGDYPEGECEFNLANDIHGANVLFSSQMPLWQITKSVYKQFAVSLPELQMKVRPYGKIGEYLFDQMAQFNMERLEFDNWPHGETWALGDEGCICALLEEVERTSHYEMIPAPRIRPDMTYEHTGENRPIRVYHLMDSRLDLEDLFARLQINFPKQ